MAIVQECEKYPFSVVASRARDRLTAAVPALSTRILGLPVTVFGLGSGFFYLTAAQGRAWGMREEHIAEVLTVQALGHCHFAFHDLVIDEGAAPAEMCLVSDACLWEYLEGVSALAVRDSRRFHALHWHYYNLYAAAIERDMAHRDRLFAYAPQDIMGLGDKAGPGATVIHLAAELAGRSSCDERPASALLRLCTGLQLVDDLNDSGLDAAVNNRTWPVTSALLAYPHVDMTDRGMIEAAVVGSGAAEGCLRLALEAFSDARALALEAEATVIADLAESWKGRTAERLQQLETALGVA
ncbi:hypothetical protein ACWDZ6_24260 [Streptomyces sp. NPDC002926]